MKLSWYSKALKRIPDSSENSDFYYTRQKYIREQN